MATPSPTCLVKQGAGSYGSTSGGVDIDPSAVVVIKLASQAGVQGWEIRCETADDLSDAAAVTASLTIDPLAQTATFTAPSSSGSAYRFYSRVNGGVDVNGIAQPTYETTFGLYTRTFGNLRVGADDESTEGGRSGWGASVNALIRASDGEPATGGNPPGTPDESMQFRVNATTFGGMPEWKYKGSGRILADVANAAHFDLDLGTAGAFPTIGFVRVQNYIDDSYKTVIAGINGGVDWRWVWMTGGNVHFGDRETGAYTTVEAGNDVTVNAGVDVAINAAHDVSVTATNNVNVSGYDVDANSTNDVNVTAANDVNVLATHNTTHNAGNVAAWVIGTLTQKGEVSYKVRNRAHTHWKGVLRTIDGTSYNMPDCLWTGIDSGVLDNDGFDQVGFSVRKNFEVGVVGDGSGVLGTNAHAFVSLFGNGAYHASATKKGVALGVNDGLFHPDMFNRVTYPPETFDPWGGGIGVRYRTRLTTAPTGVPTLGIWDWIDATSYNPWFKKPDGTIVEIRDPNIASGDATNSLTYRQSIATVSQSSNSDTTLSAAQYACPIIRITATGGLTAAFNIIAPNSTGSVFTIDNTSTFPCTFKKSGGTGVRIPAGARAEVYHDGTDYRFRGQPTVASVVRLTKASQSIPTGTVTAITFASALEDTDAYWAIGNASRATAATAGEYQADIDVKWDVSSDGNYRWASIYLNGSEAATIVSAVLPAAATSDGVALTQSRSFKFRLSAGDYHELRVLHDGSTSHTIAAGRLVVTRIGD